MLKKRVFQRIKVSLIGIIEFFVAILHRRKEITTSTTRKNDNSSSKYDLQNLRNHETFYPFIRPCFSYLNEL